MRAVWLEHRGVGKVKREHKWRASKGGAEFIKPSSLNLIQEAMRRHLRRMQ